MMVNFFWDNIFVIYTLGNIFFLLILPFYFLYTRRSIIYWASAAIIYLLLLTIMTKLSLSVLAILWVSTILILLVLTVPMFRVPLISSHAFKFAQKQLPRISSSESEALKSGTVSWDGEIFSGAPNWNILFSYQPASMSQEEIDFIAGPVEAICKFDHSPWDMWHKNLAYPKDLAAFAKENGMMGMIIPKKYGGKEFSVMATWQTIMKISHRVGPLATWVTIANSIGAGELIDRYGTESQKDYYLPRLARGVEIPSFALTSPIAGSDATSIEDHGIVCKGEYKGKNVLGVRLNFNKRYITLGNEATIISLAFKLYDPDHLLGDQEELGITLGLVPSKLDGFTHGRCHYPIGAPFHNGPLQGKDVFIPLEENIIGGREGVGKAWAMLTQVLATGRATSLPTGAVSASKYALYTTAAYCSIRKQFGLPVGAFQSVQEKLAEMAALTYLSDALRLFTFSQIQAGERPAIPAAISKYNTTEFARQCAIHAIDLQGGKGVMNGPSNMVATLYASAPVGVTVEGSNTMTRGLIVFGQGAVRCHPYILKEMNALENNDRFGFDKLVMKHINFTMSNHVRSLLLRLTGGRLTGVPTLNSDMKRSLQQITALSAAFALLSDMSMMLLGGKLKRMEALSGRFADVFSMLFMATASIKHFHDKGYPPELLPIVQWSNQWALNIAEQQLYDIIDNFPNIFVKYWLRFFIFPFGRRIKKPDDTLTLEVGKLVQASKSVREQLAEGLFITACDNNPLTQLEEALEATTVIEPINKRILAGVKNGTIKGYTYLEHIAHASKTKLISKAEEKLLLNAHEKIMKIINVDDFSRSELQQQK